MIYKGRGQPLVKPTRIFYNDCDVGSTNPNVQEIEQEGFPPDGVPPPCPQEICRAYDSPRVFEASSLPLKHPVISLILFIVAVCLYYPF